jgi:hypothetical protein
LVVKGRDHHIAHTALDDRVLDRSTGWVTLQIFDDQEPPLLDRPRIDGPGEISGAVVVGIGEDAVSLERAPVVQQEHLVPLDGGKA